MDFVIGAYHGNPWAFRAEEQGIYWNREARDLDRNGEMNLSIRPRQQMAPGIGNINFGQQGACRWIDGVRGTDHFAAEFLARIFAQLDIGRKPGADRRSIALRDADEDAQRINLGDIEQLFTCTGA